MRSSRAVVAIVLVSLIAAACGDDDGAATPSGPTVTDRTADTAADQPDATAPALPVEAGPPLFSGFDGQVMLTTPHLGEGSRPLLNGMSWAVIAYDGAELPLPVSEQRPIAP